MADSRFNVNLTNLNEREVFALNALATTFNVANPRPFQKELIVHALRGHSVLAVMPTGWGKSTLYQVPAVALPGTAIIVSPLIALMDDQVASLRRMGVSAAAIHSGTTPSDYERTVSELESGTLKILFNSPKRLDQSNSWLERLSQEVNVSLIGADEAHLIVDWGHSGFVNSYQTVFRKLRRRFPNAPVVATTASSTTLTTKAILGALGFRLSDIGSKVQYVRIPPDRPEIALQVKTIPPADRAARDKALVTEFEQMLDEYWFNSTSRDRGTGIIYTVTKRDAEHISEVLSRRFSPLKIPFYHAEADLSTTEEESYFEYLRQQLEQRRIPAIVATSAAGMGLDIESLRYAIHDGMRTSIEEYWQQVGRLGRTREKLRDGFCKAVLITDQLEASRWSFALRNKVKIFVQRAELAFSYPNAPMCRKGLIVGYLSDSFGPDCGYCDRCLETRGGNVMSGDFDHTLGILRASNPQLAPSELLMHPIHGLGAVISPLGSDSARAIFVDGGLQVEKVINLNNVKKFEVRESGFERHPHFDLRSPLARLGEIVCVNGQFDGKLVRINDVFCEILTSAGKNAFVPIGTCRSIAQSDEVARVPEGQGNDNVVANRSEKIVSAEEVREEMKNQDTKTSWWRD